MGFTDFLASAAEAVMDGMSDRVNYHRSRTQYCCYSDADLYGELLRTQCYSPEYYAAFDELVSRGLKKGPKSKYAVGKWK